MDMNNETQLKTSDGLTDIRAIQLCVLDIYKEIKKICDENNIRYFAIGGTAIGAVRNGGIIPWDDDIDIVIPRKDYVKFAELVKQRLPRHYRAIDNTVDWKSQETAMRICDERTTMTAARALKKKDYFLYKGVGVDVMPIDGVPGNYSLYRLHRLRLKFLHALNAIANQTNLFSWKPRVLAVILLSGLLQPINKKGLFKRAFMNANAKYDFDESKYLARTWLFASHDGMQAAKRYHQEDFKDYVEMDFEDTTIRLPVGYDRYLSSLYPNYMTPPPVSKQKPHYFEGIVDMEHSYRYHIAKRENKTIGYTAGCYDMFHIGHLNLIEKAKLHCDYLIVGVNSDDSMYAYKKKYPIIPEGERMRVLAALEDVDQVTLVTDTDKMNAYKKHKYDVIFVGDDHKAESKWMELEKKLKKNNSKVQYFSYTSSTSSTILRGALNARIKGEE